MKVSPSWQRCSIQHEQGKEQGTQSKLPGSLADEQPLRPSAIPSHMQELRYNVPYMLEGQTLG